ncbi:MAG TPA: CapA family protein [Solirubrobacteraceae bacterium]|nr:CapA family protein [Solirubrobacteraceae bacterium]
MRSSPLGVLLGGALVGLFGLVTITVVPLAVGPDRIAERRAAAAPPPARAERRATSITIGWVGDITPGSRYGLPAAGGRGLFAAVRRALREPDLMAGNLEGTFSRGGVSKCGAGAADCYAFQAPPGNARALSEAGFDLVNLANNHSFDYGRDGQWQTLTALNAARIAFTGLPAHVRVLTRRGIRVAFIGFSTYRWTTSMNDARMVRALVDQGAAIADVVVVLFHAGAEGSERTAVPPGREWAFGEDRGDSRAFAHLAIDAGADLVLGSGPHVIRGIETYRGRLIAYSLGNFAGVRNFASGGPLSQSGILSVRVDRSGRVRNGWWHGVALDASGTPRPDGGASRALVARLSARDFGAGAARVRPSGRVLPAPAERR